MRNKRLLIPVVVALALPLMGCFQCAAGSDITQSSTIQLTDPTCLIVGFGFLAIMLGLVMLGSLGGGMGGR